MSKAQISNVIDSGKGKIGGLIVLALALLLTPILIITVAGVAVIGAAGVGGMQNAQMNDTEAMGGGGGKCSTTVSGQTGSSSAGTSTDQDINNNVRTIIGVGKGLGISDVGIKIALIIIKTGVCMYKNSLDDDDQPYVDTTAEPYNE